MESTECFAQSSLIQVCNEYILFFQLDRLIHVVADELTRADKILILRYLDQIKVPDERKTISNLSFHRGPA